MSHRRRAQEAGPEVTLPITPMLDMSFQLLFFFMATFNPTDVEGTQTLAIAREKKAPEEKKDKTDIVATEKNKIDPDVKPAPPKKEEKKEELELDQDLRLIIDVQFDRNGNARGGNPIKLIDGDPDTIKEGQTVKGAHRALWAGDKLTDEKLVKMLKEQLESSKDDAKRKALKAGPLDSPDYKTVYEAELAKRKVRIQTTMDVPWREVFEAMNLVTRVGFKPALTSPSDYVPKVKAPD